MGVVVPEHLWLAAKRYCVQRKLAYYADCPWFRIGTSLVRINNDRRLGLLVHPDGQVIEVEARYK